MSSPEADPQRSPVDAGRTYDLRVAWIALVLCACSVAAAASAEPADPTSTTAGSATSEVADELRRICERLRESDEPYYGRAQLRQLRRAVTQPLPDPLDAALVKLQLGRELVEHGRPGEAIEVLQAAIRSFPAEARASEVYERLVATLALAHLQAAEDENCLHHGSAESCILPIGPEGVHRKPRHALHAAELYRHHLELRPGNPVSAWLLNLAAMVAGEHPDAVPADLRLPEDALESGGDFPPWPNRAAALGVDVVDLAGGAIMDDFDGDGLLDLVTSTSDHCDSLKAFRNNGRGGFADVTEAWGLSSQLGGLNLVHGDYDGDGRLDLLVLRGAWLFEHGHIRNSLLRNVGTGDGPLFVDVTRAAGLAEPALPTQTAAWADFDGDGDLDLYVGNESRPRDRFTSQLFRNDGDGTFTDVTRTAGVANHRYAKAVAWGDYDNDGDPDLYVSNIGENRLYRNEGRTEGGQTRFRDVAPELGLTRPELRSFASWFFDYDNDGDLDLFVAAYQASVAKVVSSYFGMRTEGDHPLVYRNDGGRFHEVSEELGLDSPSLPMGANYGDLDNDGWLDVYLGTGDPEYESLVPNLMLRNESGERFIDVTGAGRFGHLQKGHGVAFGDFDADGDQDILHQLGGFYPGDAFGNALFVNPHSENRWITLRLVGREANRFGVGARIELRIVEGDERRSIHRVAGTGGSFGGSSHQQEIGLGRAERIEELRIRWPGSGTVQVFTSVPVDRVYRVVEGEASLEVVSQRGSSRPEDDDGIEH